MKKTIFDRPRDNSLRASASGRLWSACFSGGTCDERPEVRARIGGALLQGGVNRFVLAGWLAVALFALSSCRKAEERLSERIRLEAVERIEPLSPTSAEAVVRVKNAMRHKLALEAAELTIYYGESRVGTLVLQEPVEVPRRTTGSFATRWRLKIADPLALYVLVRKVQAGELASIGVSYAAQGRGGPVPVKISRARMPLSEFLNTFGVSIQELENRLK